MSIPWSGDKCIICLTPGALTEEHVIPEAIGGMLTCEFLCKPCNDHFGAGFEAKAKSDPGLRLSVARLQPEIPTVHATIEEGQRYRIKTDVTELPGLWRKGVIRGRVARLEDGSLMAPAECVPRKLREMLENDHDEAFIGEALAKQASAPIGERVYLSDTISIVNWRAESLGPDIRAGEPLHDLVLVKIAYEFMALLIGTAIYAEVPQLAAIRFALKTQDNSSSIFTVERLAADREGALHGIAFEGNDPHARFQVRLLGKWAYRVHFLRLSVQHPPIAYTHDLKTGEHWHNGAAEPKHVD